MCGYFARFWNFCSRKINQLFMPCCACVSSITRHPIPHAVAHLSTLIDDVRAQGGKVVKAGEAFVPEAMFQGKYYPICAHGFADNEYGAASFCKLLGFNSGMANKTGTVYDVDALLIGKCKSGEELTKCTGGLNYWGDLLTCKKGDTVGVNVICNDPGVCSLGKRYLTLTV